MLKSIIYHYDNWSMILFPIMALYIFILALFWHIIAMVHCFLWYIGIHNIWSPYQYFRHLWQGLMFIRPKMLSIFDVNVKWVWNYDWVLPTLYCVWHGHRCLPHYGLMMFYGTNEPDHRFSKILIASLAPSWTNANLFPIVALERHHWNFDLN